MNPTKNFVWVNSFTPKNVGNKSSKKSALLSKFRGLCHRYKSTKKECVLLKQMETNPKSTK